MEQIYTFIDTRQDFRRNTPTRNSKLLFHLLTFPYNDHHISTRITFYPRYLFSLCIRYFHQAFSPLPVDLITSSSRLYHHDLTQNVHGPPLHACFRPPSPKYRTVNSIPQLDSIGQIFYQGIYNPVMRVSNPPCVLLHSSILLFRRVHTC